MPGVGKRSQKSSHGKTAQSGTLADCLNFPSPYPIWCVSISLSLPPAFAFLYFSLTCCIFNKFTRSKTISMAAIDDSHDPAEWMTFSSDWKVVPKETSRLLGTRAEQSRNVSPRSYRAWLSVQQVRLPMMQRVRSAARGSRERATIRKKFHLG